MSPRRIRLTIGYDGTDYAGWQRQVNGLGIQQELEDVLQRLFGEEVHVMGSGRTDAGVHARGQVAVFDLNHSIPVRQLKLALNANLPEDIRIYEAEECPVDFHPQYGAKRKTYRYRFYQGAVMPPEYRRYMVLAPEDADWELGERMLPLLEGEHDFAACCASGSCAASTVRTIYRARLLKEAEGPSVYTLELTGNVFLYNMVRIIAGTLLEAARGKISWEIIEKALREGARKELGPTAPAKGLILWKVEY